MGEEGETEAVFTGMHQTRVHSFVLGSDDRPTETKQVYHIILHI